VIGERAWTRAGLGWREAGVAAAAFLVVGFAILGAHVANGGFMLDDWTWASDHERLGGFFHTAWTYLRSSTSYGGSRPGEAIYFALTFGILGNHVGLQLAFALVLAAFMSTAVYCVLRGLGLELVHAGAIALLVLLFPAADAPRLWTSAAYGQLGVGLYACGVLLTLRGLRLRGRDSYAWHLGGLACYAASLLTYEVAMGGVLVGVLLYRLRVPWRAALRRWVFDLALIVPEVVYLHHTKAASVSVGHLVDRARLLQGEGRILLTHLGIETGGARIPFWAFVLVVAVALAAAFAGRVPAATRGPLRRWLAILAAGVVAVGAGYLPFVSSSAFYTPLRQGTGNRTNIAAATGFAVVVYALAMLVASAAGRRWLGAAVSAALVGSLAGLWIDQLNQDRQTWDRAAAIDRQTLAAVREAGRPPSGTRIYTFGQPGQTAPFVFTFSASWDLSGAVELLWHDRTLYAVPSPTLEPDFPNIDDPSKPGNTPANSGLACRARDVQPRGWLYVEGRDASTYGKTLFVDVPTGRHELVRDRGTCLDWTRQTASR